MTTACLLASPCIIISMIVRQAKLDMFRMLEGGNKGKT